MSRIIAAQVANMYAKMSKSNYYEGQTVFGKAEKMLSDKAALIKIGNETILAQVNVPLEEGQSYVFEVKQTKKEQLVLTIKNDQIAREISPKLMAEMEKFLQETTIGKFLKDNNITLTKELYETLQQLKETKGLSTLLQAMNKLSIPITSKNVALFQNMFLGVSLPSAVEKMKGQILQLPISNSGKQELLQILQNLPQALTVESKKYEQNFSQNTMPMKQSSNEPQIKVFNDKISTLNQQKGNAEMNLSSQVTSVTKSLQQLAMSSNSMQMQVKDTIATIAQNMPKENIAKLQQFTTIVDELSIQITQLPKDNVTPQVMQNFVQKHGNLLQSISLQGTILLQQLDKMDVKDVNQKQLLQKVQENIQTIIKIATVNIQNQNQRSTQEWFMQFKDFVEKVFQNKEVMNHFQAKLNQIVEEQGFTTVFAKTLQDDAIITSNKYQALSTIMKDQPQYSFFLPVQVPIKGENYSSELHIRFEGKRNKEGKLNPKFCHIFFFLEMPHLNNIGIDMNFQDHLVNIKVMSSIEELQSIASPLQEKIDELLYQKNYKKIVWQYESFPSEKVETELLHEWTQPPRTGVDITI